MLSVLRARQGDEKGALQPAAELVNARSETLDGRMSEGKRRRARGSLRRRAHGPLSLNCSGSLRLLAEACSRFGDQGDCHARVAPAAQRARLLPVDLPAPPWRARLKRDARLRDSVRPARRTGYASFSHGSRACLARERHTRTDHRLTARCALLPAHAAARLSVVMPHRVRLRSVLGSRPRRERVPAVARPSPPPTPTPSQSADRHLPRWTPHVCRSLRVWKSRAPPT